MISGTTRPRSVLAWAGYLAASWTWCIGMFLPALLVRDFGLWSFVVFAAPNVLGAAAMGWVLRPGASERVVAVHGAALVTFSAVTVAFQAFFAVWAAGWLGVPPWALGAGVLGLAAVLATGRGWAAGPAAWAVLGVSTVALGLGLARGVFAVPTAGEAPLGDQLLPLAAVCGLGFALCPYLDATFHRARQAQGAEASAASFGLGFGVLFSAMIVGTLLYARDAARAMEGAGVPSRLFAALLVVHLGVQLAYTIGAHGAAAAHGAHSRRRRAALAVACGVGVAMGVGVALAPAGFRHGGLAAGEVVYRGFMGFYGLVFPAYVWLCVLPRRGERSAAPTRGRLMLLAAVIALASPAYWMGFIERETWWLLPGVGLVLAARLLIGGRAGQKDWRPDRAPDPAADPASGEQVSATLPAPAPNA